MQNRAYLLLFNDVLLHPYTLPLYTLTGLLSERHSASQQWAVTVIGEKSVVAILIADDEPISREYFRKVLSQLSMCSVLEAEDGISALEQVRIHQPGLALLDILMPQLNGLEVCRLMKSDPTLYAIPVIIVTASADPAHRVIAHRAGADGFMVKPIKENELLWIAARFLQNYAPQQ